jgi:DNA-binding transcriptional LysR family regulator
VRTLTGLRVVREVAERGSFTAAAASLGYTQSAVSRQVAAMEAAAGGPLFRRASRGVRLTEAGSVLLRHADRVLDQIDVARRELAVSPGLATGRPRVGAFPTAVAALLPRAIAAFRSRHAGIDPLLLAVGRSHALARRRTVDVDDLAREPWIAAGTNPDDTFLGVWPSLEWRPQIAFVAREWTAKLGLIGPEHGRYARQSASSTVASSWPSRNSRHQISPVQRRSVPWDAAAAARSSHCEHETSRVSRRTPSRRNSGRAAGAR